MLLENELVEMKWSNTNKRRYIEKGYIYTKNGDTFLVKPKDILECSAGVKIPVKCDYCGKTYYPTSTNYLKVKARGEKDCCSNCNGKTKESVINKYGVNNVTLVPEIREKQINTCIQKYGTQTPLECKEIFNKTVLSLNKNFNLKNGIADLRKIPAIIEKTKATNLKKFGGNAPLSSSEIRAKVSETMWKNGTCKTSLKQLELAKLIKEIYGNCEINYPCDKVSLDCVVIVNNIKIDVEYDGYYWHRDEQRDRRRDNFVKSKGYKILRILAYQNRIPTIEELTDSINFLLTNNNSFYRIELRKS